VTFGPVSAAQHSQPTMGGALFSLGIGVSVLTYLWYRYFTRTEEEESKTSIGNVIWISAVCFVFVAVGIWELVRSLGA
jgi:UDP-N-acetylmuramyl pentapeptide phosphotransferase/UDP-N-acetylglucosamine-1-phosphate transferase